MEEGRAGQGWKPDLLRGRAGFHSRPFDGGQGCVSGGQVWETSLLEGWETVRYGNLTYDIG